MTELKWPRKVVLVRHGQSTQNVVLDLIDDDISDLYQDQKGIRDADIRLTDVGKWQARQTGIHLAKTHTFDYCLCSPYKRTMETAEEIISKLGYPLDIRQDDRLIEKEFGRLHGYTVAEIKAEYPKEYARRKLKGKYWYRVPQGENYPDVGVRIQSLRQTLFSEERYSGEILIITSKVPYLMFRATTEEFSELGVLALGDVPNCGIQEYLRDTTKYSSGVLELIRFNEVAYKS